MSSNIPQEKGLIIPTELTLRATQLVKASVEEDLKVLDPTPESAEAVLEGESEND